MSDKSEKLDKMLRGDNEQLDKARKELSEFIDTLSTSDEQKEKLIHLICFFSLARLNLQSNTLIFK